MTRAPRWEPRTARPRPTVLRRAVAGVTATTIVIALGAFSCDDRGGPAQPPVTYPKLPASPISYTLPDPGPSRYEVVYQSGRLNLREDADRSRFMIGFRVDLANRDKSELVKSNKATGEKNGWRMEPISPDGGSGYRAEYQDGEDRYLFYFFAKGIVSGTLTVNLGPGSDAQLRAAAEEVMSSFKFDESKLAGPTPLPDPPQPFTYVLPKQLVGQPRSAMLRDFTVNLFYGKQPVQVVTSVVESADVAHKTYVERRDNIAKTGATIRELKDQHDNPDLVALSKKVDEGYVLKITTQGQPALGALIFRRGALYCTVTVRAVEPLTEEGLPALVAPFEMAETITFRD